MQLFSQRDRRWASHALGWGPALGTIGAFGCDDTVDSMILTDTGHALNPAATDDAYTGAKLFVKDPTGTYDFLSDDSLARLFPGEYACAASWGWNVALIAQIVRSPNVYAKLWISTAAVPTHFVIAASADGKTIADPWTGAFGTLSGYGGPAAVKKIIAITHIKSVKPNPIPPPPPPVVVPPEPHPVPSPVPMLFVQFLTGDDTHPADGVMPLSSAEWLADDWLNQHPGKSIEVNDGNGHILYTNGRA